MPRNATWPARRDPAKHFWQLGTQLALEAPRLASQQQGLRQQINKNKEREKIKV